MGWLSDLFDGGGQETNVNTSSQQDIQIDATTNVLVDNEGIGQGIAELGESIGEGLAEQQDIININISTIDEGFNQKILDNVKLIGMIAVIGLVYYLSKNKKGGISSGFKIQLPKNTGNLVKF